MMHKEKEEPSNPFPVSTFKSNGWLKILVLGSEEDAVSRVLDSRFRAPLRLCSVFE